MKTFNYVAVYYSNSGKEVGAAPITVEAEDRGEADVLAKAEAKEHSVADATRYYVYPTSWQKDSITEHFMVTLDVCTPSLFGFAMQAWAEGAWDILKVKIRQHEEKCRRDLIEFLTRHGISGDHIRAFEEATGKSTIRIKIE